MASELEDPVATAETNIDAERLRLAIRRLTEDQAKVVSLRFLEGYRRGSAEVASMTNRTEGAIKALRYRAVATLRGLLLRAHALRNELWLSPPMRPESIQGKNLSPSCSPRR